MSKLFKSLYNRFSAGLVDPESVSRFALKTERRGDVFSSDVVRQLGSLEESELFNLSLISNDVKKFIKGRDYSPYVSEWLESPSLKGNSVNVSDLEYSLGNYLTDSILKDYKFYDPYSLECNVDNHPDYLCATDHSCLATPVETIQVRSSQEAFEYSGPFEQLDFDLAGYAKPHLCECLYKVEISDLVEEIESKKAVISELVAQLKVYLIGRTQVRYLKSILCSPTFNFYPVSSVIEIHLISQLMEYRDIVGSLREADNHYGNEVIIFNTRSIISFFNNDNNECKGHNKHTLFLN